MDTRTLPAISLVAHDGHAAWRDNETGRIFPVIRGGDGPTAEAPTTIEIPADLTAVEDPAELETMRDSVVAALQALGELDSPTADQVAEAEQLAQHFDALETELTSRTTERETRVTAIGDLISSRVSANGGDDAGTEGGEGNGGETAPVEGGEAAPAEGSEGAPADAPAEGAVEAVAASSRQPVRVPAVPRRPTLNPSLAEIARRAPAADIPEPDIETIITAAAEIPGIANGSRLATLDDLVRATIERAGSMGDTNGSMTPVHLCNIARSYDHVLDEASAMDLEAVDRVIRDAIGATTPAALEALVAAGGWCAPSQIRYEFFNIAEPPETWDVPTVGIQRGGLRWPDSMSLADFFAISGAPASGIPSASTMPWEWTEADDIATITGSGTKVCLRPPCPDFTEARLRAFGVCVTAGNLTEDAYPELIRHFVSNVIVAHQRVMNRRHIAQAVALATGVTPVVGDVDAAVTPVLGAAELYAIHTREKFGMSSNAVIEAVFPSWYRGVARSDMAKRQGVDLGNMAVTDAMLMDWFDARRIRAQWVQDWQTLPGSAGPANTIGAATPPTAWPSSVLSLMYAPGTYFRGAGMNLRLGLIRDSVLNAENDHTAEWSEEATLIGMFGHEALLVTNTIKASGQTGGGVDVSTGGV